MANRLALESSPYLLQHAANPVDWYAWGTEALERARREDKPILLSIGYAACHWCHVMAHESFENAETAALMNALFVNIKVDREERPDLDSIYMQAVQAMTGQGGWPMTVFLTPACEPFYGGTYFPPRDRHGLPSFGRILQAVADAYREKRASVEATAAQLREMYEKITLPPTRSTAGHELTPALLDRAVHGLVQAFDEDNGGFGGAPKFPPSMSLDFLLQQSARSARTGDEALDIVRRSFLAMARGGIYDQVGGGLHRYSVDERWLVPHFEKMLYDNALFVRLGSHLWQVTRDPEVHRVVSETIAWAAREMMSAEGGFYSSLDADSEGEEGRFYVWSAAGFDAGAGDDAELLSAVWGVTPEGNFEGKNILHVAAEPSTVAVRSGITPRDMEHRMNLARLALRAIREQRVRPGRDDKVLAGWNGLMLRALADAARIFDDDDFATLALRNASFLSRELVQDGEVRRTWKEGRRSDVGFLEDHAAVALGFLELYALTFDRDWVGRAREIAESIRRRFLDPSRGVLFDTPSEHEELLTRPRDLTDNALPAGNSLASELFLRLGILLDDVDYRTIAVQQVEPLGEGMGRYPSAFGHLLSVADMMVHGAVEVVMAGVGAPPATASEGRVRTLTRIVAETYVPSLVLAGVGGSASGGAVSSERQVIEGESAVTEPEMHQGLLADRLAAPGGGMAYVCRRYVCDAPTSEPEVLSEQLRAAART